MEDCNRFRFVFECGGAVATDEGASWADNCGRASYDLTRGHVLHETKPTWCMFTVGVSLAADGCFPRRVAVARLPSTCMPATRPARTWRKEAGARQDPMTQAV